MRNLVSNIKSGKMDFMVFMPLEELGENPNGTILFYILFSIFEINQKNLSSSDVEQKLFMFPKTVEFIKPGVEGAPTVNRNEVGVRIKFDSQNLGEALTQKVCNYFQGLSTKGVLFESLLLDKIQEEGERKKYFELYQKMMEVDILDVLDRYLFLDLYTKRGVAKILKRDFSHRCEIYQNKTESFLKAKKLKKAGRWLSKNSKIEEELSDLIFNEIIYSIVAYINCCYGVFLEIETDAACSCGEENCNCH